MMYKNFLTHFLSQSFDHELKLLEFDHPLKNRILRSSEAVVEFLSRFTQTEKSEDQRKYLAVAYQNLQDCKDTLEACGIDDFKIWGRHQVLKTRIEQMIHTLRTHKKVSSESQLKLFSTTA